MENSENFSVLLLFIEMEQNKRDFLLSSVLSPDYYYIRSMSFKPYKSIHSVCSCQALFV